MVYVLGCHKLRHPRDPVVYSLCVWSVLVGARSPAPHLQTGQRLASLNASQPLQCLVTAPDLSMPQNIEWLLLDLSLSQIYIFRAKQNYQMPTSAARRGNPAFWLCRWIFVLCKHTHSQTHNTHARAYFILEKFVFIEMRRKIARGFVLFIFLSFAVWTQLVSPKTKYKSALVF
jgi:hypothetical protein